MNSSSKIKKNQAADFEKYPPNIRSELGGSSQ